MNAKITYLNTDKIQIVKEISSVLFNEKNTLTLLLENGCFMKFDSDVFPGGVKVFICGDEDNIDKLNH